jgi:hypothetical protein
MVTGFVVGFVLGLFVVAVPLFSWLVLSSAGVDSRP